VDFEPADALARSAWADDIEYYRNDECFDAERAANELRAKADRADARFSLLNRVFMAGEVRQSGTLWHHIKEEVESSDSVVDEVRSALRAEIEALKANTWLTLLERMTPLLLPVINCTTMTNQYLEEVQAIYNKATAELKSADAEEADIETGS